MHIFENKGFHTIHIRAATIKLPYLGPTSTWKPNTFCALFTILKNGRETTTILPKVWNLFGKGLRIWKVLSGNFYSRHLNYAHPGILAYFCRSEPKPFKRYFKWHPELKKITKSKKDAWKSRNFTHFEHRDSTMVAQNHREILKERVARLIGNLIVAGLTCKHFRIHEDDAWTRKPMGGGTWGNMK